MKIFIKVLSSIYKYATAFVIVGSPLFFVPATTFSPDVTYYITMTAAIAIALLSYIIVAILTKTWHPVSRFELIAYSAFSLALVLSYIFSNNKGTLFGEGINPFSAVSLMGIPATMYLVRTLPENFRNRLKQIMIAILGIASLVFIFSTIFSGQMSTWLSAPLSGFSSATSLIVYVGISVIALLIYAKVSNVHIKYRTVVAVTAVVIALVLVMAGIKGDTRPSFSLSLAVGQQVLVNKGIFGVGAGDFVRAWQLYRPSSVIESPLFGVDFNQASGTMMTFLSTIGIVGVLAFLFLVLGSLVSTYQSYKRATDTKDKVIFGLITTVLLYFAIISWVVPFSYSMLIVWAVLAGLGLAKHPLGEFHPAKMAVYVFIPIVALFTIHGFLTFKKAAATIYFNNAQSIFATKGATPEVEALLGKATSIYPYDGFYRAQVEYAISKEKLIINSNETGPDEIKAAYLEKAKYAVDAGLNAVKNGSYNYQNYVSLGRAYELAIPFDKDKAYASAKKSYTDATNLYNGNPYLYITLARLESSAGTKEGVKSYLTQALAKKTNFADAQYFMSQLEASNNNVDDALTYALQAEKNAPSDPAVYTQAGLLFYGKKDYQNAISSFQEALKIDQTNANTAYFLAVALRDGGRPDLAKMIATELIKQNPNNSSLTDLMNSLEPKAATPTKAKK